MALVQPVSETPDLAKARIERHLGLLAELAEIGMDLAREVRRQALDQTDAAPPAAELALTFSRIARAVRQTVALESKLAEETPSGLAVRPALDVSDRWRSARRKRQVKVIVGRVLEAESNSDFEANRLFKERDERLNDGDEEADFADCPIGELVARICRDLGVNPDWSQFKDEDWGIDASAASTSDRLSHAKREGRASKGFPPSLRAQSRPTRAGPRPAIGIARKPSRPSP
jgi:hypothetical protein